MLPSFTAREAVDQYNSIGPFNSEGFHYTRGDSPDTVAAVSMRGDIFTCNAKMPQEWLIERIMA